MVSMYICLAPNPLVMKSVNDRSEAIARCGV